MEVTSRDSFWAAVNLILIDLPRPGDVLDRLEARDPELHKRLVEGERWMLMPERSLDELVEGWRWWLKLYRRAVEIVSDVREQRNA